MAFRQVGGDTVEATVFVDDRCPTIWQEPRFNSSPRGVTVLPLEEPRNCGRPTQTAQNDRDAALYTNKPKAINGSLLRKLFKATVEEKKKKKRTSGHAVVTPKPGDEPAWKRHVKDPGPPGFHIPPAVGTPRPRALETSKEISNETPQLPTQAARPIKKHEKTVPVTPARSAKSSSGKTNLLHISGKGGEEVFVEVPSPPPSAFAAKDGPGSFPLEDLDDSMSPDNVKALALPITAENIRVKANDRKAKKTTKKAKRKQKMHQERATSPTGSNPDLDFTNDNQVVNALNGGHALMSGALTAASTTGPAGAELHATAYRAESHGITEESRLCSSYEVGKEGPASRQPTVELAASRVSSKASKASNTFSAREPISLKSPSPKLSSYRSFEEVGEAWVGPVASPAGSYLSHIPRSASKVPSDLSGELEKQFLEPISPRERVERSIPTPVPSIESARSSRQFMPGVHHSSVAEDVPEKPSERQSHAIETRSRQVSAHSGSHRLPDGKYYAHSHSRQSNLRHSSTTKSFKRSHSHKSGSKDFQEPDGSLHLSLYQEQLLNEGHVLARKQEAEVQNTKIAEDYKSRSPSGTHSAHRSRSIDESRSAGSRHSKERHHASRRPRRPSRHASTRSFSPIEDLWDGSPSIRSSARGESQRSCTHQSEDVVEHRNNRHSTIASAIGSLVSMVSKVRSGFEEIGEGWHDGAVSSDELKQQIWEGRSSTQASTQILGPIVNAERDDWDEIIRSEQLSSKASSRHPSRASTLRSRYSEVHSRPHSSRAPSTSGRSRLGLHPHSPVKAPMHAVISSASEEVVGVGSHDDNNSRDRSRKQRATVFAGRGWITPHPLESSIAERASAIVLPSDATPNGATLSYEEYKAIQENGLRGHRNFSVTESNVSERERHNNNRYRFSGWQSRSWHEVQPADRDPNVASALHAVETMVRGPASERSARVSSKGQSPPSRLSSHGSVPPVSPSERLWERMEEGDAGSQSCREDSVLSDKDDGRANSGWRERSQLRSRGSRSASRLRE